MTDYNAQNQPQGVHPLDILPSSNTSSPDLPEAPNVNVPNSSSIGKESQTQDTIDKPRSPEFNRLEKSLTEYERRVLRATWVGVVVALLTIIASGFFSYRQLNELVESGKQTNTLLEQHSREIDALEKLANATRDSVMVVQNAEKAKIGFRVANINWSKKEFLIALENMGRVSAEDIYIRAKVEQRSMNTNMVQERIYELTFKSITPGISEGAGFHALDPAVDIVNIHGRVFYTDGFGKRTNTGFCYSFLHTISGEIETRSCNGDARDEDLEKDKVS